MEIGNIEGNVSEISNETMPQKVVNIVSVTRAKWLMSRKG
jgi:hypothetical protein